MSDEEGQRIPPNMTMTGGPKHRRIAHHINTRIISGEFGPNEKLPRQRQLAADYGVSIVTIRQALGQLQTEGVVRAARGSGTYVGGTTFRYRINFLSSLADEMKSQHRALQTQIIEGPCRDQPTPEVRTALNLGRAGKFGCIERLRSIDGVPLILQRSFLPAKLLRQIDANQLVTTSLYEAIEKSTGLAVVRARESFQAIPLPEFAAEALNRPVGNPGMLSTRVSWSDEDEPVVADYAYFPGDAVEIETERFVGQVNHDFV